MYSGKSGFACNFARSKGKMKEGFETGLVSPEWVLKGLKRGEKLKILDASMLNKPR